MQQIWRLTWMTMVLAACTLMVTTGCRTGNGDNANDNIVANDNEEPGENVNDNEEGNENINDNTVTNENANDNTVANENANDNTGGAPDGAALFDTNCAICHPNNGVDPSGTPAVEVIAKLEGGHHSAGLTTEEIAAIAAFVASQ